MIVTQSISLTRPSQNNMFKQSMLLDEFEIKEYMICAEPIWNCVYIKKKIVIYKYADDTPQEITTPLDLTAESSTCDNKVFFDSLSDSLSTAQSSVNTMLTEILEMHPPTASKKRPLDV
ncbi:hypothetical protein AX774_g6507 [Zancudomyces culisetae]|uniref:Uncharacterized protein n=1 Tax=Zancudomyces culisetae TaxID=1213189 RepID=A0A1R1PGE4_ZANCU|nr:hypothetical protein AX774_g6507 [Zancudomyces culisetae]|eukprot:OMH80065.1 hypothetical protein AX774_g6507 [Zancudomyces culisetae]